MNNGKSKLFLEFLIKKSKKATMQTIYTAQKVIEANRQRTLCNLIPHLIHIFSISTFTCKCLIHVYHMHLKFVYKQKDCHGVIEHCFKIFTNESSRSNNNSLQRNYNLKQIHVADNRKFFC